MEKKELTQEQIERISAGAQVADAVVVAAYTYIAADMNLAKDHGALAKKLSAAGFRVRHEHIAILAHSIAMELM